jgi:hypothetical protein
MTWAEIRRMSDEQLQMEAARLIEYINQAKQQFFATADPRERNAIGEAIDRMERDLARIKAEIDARWAEKWVPRMVTAIGMAAPGAPAAAGAAGAKKAKAQSAAKLKGYELHLKNQELQMRQKDLEFRAKALKVGSVMGLIGTAGVVYHGTTELIGGLITNKYANVNREQNQQMAEWAKKKEEMFQKEQEMSEKWYELKKQELAWQMATQGLKAGAAQRGAYYTTPQGYTRRWTGYGRRSRSSGGYHGQKEQWENWLNAQKMARQMSLAERKAQLEVWEEQGKAMAQDWLNQRQAERKAMLTNLEQQWEAYNTALKEMMEERKIAAQHIAEMQKLAAETQSKAYLEELTNRLKAWRTTVEEAAKAQRELATLKAQYRAEMDLEKEQAVNNMMQAIRDEKMQMRKTAAELAKAATELAKQGHDVSELMRQIYDLLGKAKEKVTIREVRIMR